MASGAVAPPPLAGGRRGFGGRGVLLRRRLAATPMKDEPVVSTNGGKEEMIAHSVNVARKASIPGVSSSLSNTTTVTPTPLHPAEPSDLRFNRLRPTIEKSDCKYTRYFGRYVAREAIMDEEYWIAAWLRAEEHYEDQSGDRYVESFKRKFASQEFHALKKRCSRQVGEKYTCFVAVKNDDVTRTVLNSVVGTVDLCVRHPLYGEAYPAYYVVDAGYPNRSGYLSLYRCTRYHVEQWQNGPPPQGMKETFNHAHAKVRNVIERSFGVLKMKFRILFNMSKFSKDKQARIIVACMALHNFIRESRIADREFDACDADENYNPMPSSSASAWPEDEPLDEDINMNAFRDELAHALFHGM